MTLTLNYKFRAYPTPDQERHLHRAMRFVRWGWNRMVGQTKWANRQIRRGTATRISSLLAQMVRTKAAVGNRIPKLNALMLSCGGNRTKAERLLQAQDVAEMYALKRSALSKKFAEEYTNALRVRMNDGRMGSVFAKLVASHDDAWRAVWNLAGDSKVKRGAPRKKKPSEATRLALQIQKETEKVIVDEGFGRISHEDRWVSVSAAFPDRLQHKAFGEMPHVKQLKGEARKLEMQRLKRELNQLSLIRFRMHRKLPVGSVIKDLKLTRDTTRGKAEWYVIFSVDVTPEAYHKSYPQTGLACGLDPGQKTPLTLWGEDMQIPGIDGEELGPNRPYHKSKRKLRKLQRKLDRQRRMNNPDCFNEKGEWIAGKRLYCFSKRMEETEQQIRALSHHIEHQRDAQHRANINRLLSCYDTIYLGDWSDGSPKQKGEKKRKRKKSGVIRAKGVAAQETTANRVNRDNGLGRFTALLVEAAKRAGNKAVWKVREAGTTRNCINPKCGQENPALTQGLKSLSIRFWVCPFCGTKQHRDRGAAYKIMVYGQTDPSRCEDMLAEKPKRSKTARSKKAVAQAVKGSRKTPVAQMPKGKADAESARLGRDDRKVPESTSAILSREDRSEVACLVQVTSKCPVKGYAKQKLPRKLMGVRADNVTAQSVEDTGEPRFICNMDEGSDSLGGHTYAQKTE